MDVEKNANQPAEHVEEVREADEVQGYVSYDTPAPNNNPTFQQAFNQLNQYIAGGVGRPFHLG